MVPSGWMPGRPVVLQERVQHGASESVALFRAVDTERDTTVSITRGSPALGSSAH